MANPANDELHITFEIFLGEVRARVIGKDKYTLHNLGPTEQVMEAMCRFLAEQDYGEKTSG